MISYRPKNKLRLIVWTLFPILTGIFFTFSLFKVIDARTYATGTDDGIAPSSNLASIVQEENRQKYFYTNRDLTGAPKVTAKAYLVGDIDTGEVIISKNQNIVYPIASVSKLMTALIADSLMVPDSISTISRSAVATYGQNGELRIGEKIKTSDLIPPLLLESSNDAAEALAEHFGREEFIKKMNLMAQKLKMDRTSYEDPSGLSSNNKSTAADMFKLTGYLAKTNPGLLKITTRRSYSTKQHNWSNISQFLGKEGYLGGKSGFTNPAKQTGVSLFSLPLGEKGERSIAITLLQSTDRKRDIENIVGYLRKNVYYGGALGAITNWVEERVGVPDIREPDFVTIAFGGDIMMDRGVKNSVLKNFGNDYSALFENLEIFKNSDIAFANLEGPASDRGTDLKNLYSFRMDPRVIPALKGAGLSLVSVANNHAGDWGLEAYIDTLARLKENEILYTGGGMNEAESENPIIIEKYGMKIGFLGFSDVGPSWMKAGPQKAGLLLANNPRFEEIIRNAAQQVDHLVISFHFGEEYKANHNLRQQELAHKAIDNGAKIVIGHHPHVPEDTEIYKDGFIAYSLGNLIFDQSWSKETMKGLLLQVKLSKDGSMSVRKSPTQLNSAFQLQKIIPGKEEKVKFQQ